MYVRKAISFSIWHADASSLGSRMMIFRDDRVSMLSDTCYDNESKLEKIDRLLTWYLVVYDTSQT